MLELIAIKNNWIAKCGNIAVIGAVVYWTIPLSWGWEFEAFQHSKHFLSISQHKALKQNTKVFNTAHVR